MGRNGAVKVVVEQNDRQQQNINLSVNSKLDDLKWWMKLLTVGEVVLFFSNPYILSLCMSLVQACIHALGMG